MSFEIKLAKLTGTPDESGWSQIHVFKPEDINKLKTKGELYVVISTTGHQQGVEKTMAGRELLSNFHKTYFDSPENAFKSIKKAVLQVTEKYSQGADSIQVAALSYIEDVVYLAAGGGTWITIERAGRVSDLLKTVEGETKVASGYIRDDDIIVLGTSKFFQHFSSTDIVKTIQTDDIQSAEESLAPKIHALEQSGGYGALFIKFVHLQKISDPMQEENEVYEKSAPIHLENTHPQAESEQFRYEDAGSFKNEHGGDTQAINNQSDNQKFENEARLRKLNLFEKLKYRVNSTLAKILERKVYVSTEQKNAEPVTQRKKVSLSIGIILLLLLLISIGFGIRQKTVNDKKATYTTKLQEALHELEEAEQIYTLNPERSRELFVSSRQKASELTGQNINDPELSGLISRLKETQGRILGEYSVDPEPYLDLTLLSNGFNADKLALTDERLLILDKGGKKIVQISLDTKTSRILAGPGIIDKADDVGAYADRVFIINSDGIHEVKDKLTKVIDKEWIGDVLMAFYGGNIYLLEKDASAIWRYTGVDGKFSSKKNWLAQGVSVDISDSDAFVIDGSIWVLSGGRILKFTFGNPQPFSAEGVSPDLNHAKSLFTTDETQSLYVYDPENNRVVVMDKEGKYQAQYVSDSLKGAIGIVAIEKDKKLYLVYPDKLAVIELKHLK